MSIFLPELALMLMALIFFIMSLAKPEAFPKTFSIHIMALIMAVIGFLIVIALGTGADSRDNSNHMDSGNPCGSLHDP